MKIKHISEDKNTITLADGTVCEFYSVKKRKYKCRKCWFMHEPERFCDNVPCYEAQRNDGKFGVFSIRQMPKY